MSNATRFYWSRIQLAATMFREGQDLDDIQDRCCELVNEFRCPRLVQIEALKLRSRCYPDVYWFAKYQLDLAIEVITKCEEDLRTNEDLTPTEQDFAVLVKARKEVDALLEERTAAYQEEWKVKGRDPAPEEDEWYKIVESEDTGEGPMYEVAGEPHWSYESPFPTTMTSEALRGVTMPPATRRRGVHPQAAFHQEQYDEEDADEYHEDYALAQKVADGLKAEEEAVKAAAAEEKMKQLKLDESKGATEDTVMGEGGEGEGEGEGEGAPPSPASSIAGSQK